MKLQQYKQKEIISYMGENDDDAFETGFSDGFDKALELELPIKFAKWLSENLHQWEDVAEHSLAKTTKTTEEFYQYWLNNILEL